MGWIFSFIFMIVGFVLNEPQYLIAAGLFSIAGSISLKEAHFTNEIFYGEGTEEDSKET